MFLFWSFPSKNCLVQHCKKQIYDTQKVARKLAMVEADLERAEERAEQGEKYVFRCGEYIT